MLWIPIAIGSYFLSASAGIIDKILISGRSLNPITYAFYTGIFSAAVFILAPFGFSLLPASVTLLALLTGIIYLAALYFMYLALSSGEASRVIPVIGALSPIFILILSLIVLGEYPTTQQVLAIVLFIVGGWLLVVNKNSKNSRFSFSLLRTAVLSSFFLALTFFLTKEVFIDAPFISGFIWMRLGSALAAFLLLLVPVWRGKIFETHKATSKSSFSLFLANKVIGATGFILLNYSIKLGPVGIINAMKSIEQFFIFMIALFFTILFPNILKESFNKKNILEKIGGILLIGIGFIFLI